VESLAVELRGRSVRTFVSHSSLSADERHRAESAFASGDDCVIVATSTLELGIDVGDLDRVIQIDAPNTVASFLQRLGRTGRRKGTDRNCLFLATTDDALLKAVALVELWRSAFVEPIEPPALPYHVLAQQLLALSLQESGVGKRTWIEWIPGLLSGSGISGEEVDALVRYMLSESVLFEDEGLLGIGTEGEGRYGLKNFLELFSIFTSPPLFTVLHGRSEIGQVHQLTFQARSEGPTTLALGGRHWSVKHVDWDRRQAFVEPTELRGRSRWLGVGHALSFALCQAVKSVLVKEGLAPQLSRRGNVRLEEVREDYAWLTQGKTSLVADGSSLRWWTFAGSLVNACLATMLSEAGCEARFDDFALRLESCAGAERSIHQLRQSLCQGIATTPENALKESVDRIKFIDCVPAALRQRMMRERQIPLVDCEKIARQMIAKVRHA
jgi:ATP-dependent Lhr-like helicase